MGRDEVEAYRQTHEGALGGREELKDIAGGGTETTEHVIFAGLTELPAE